MRSLLVVLVATCILVVVQSAAVQFGCPGGLGVVNCFVDPCMIPMQQGCHGYPNAKCVSNYCGGCNAEWYDNGQLVFCH